MTNKYRFNPRNKGLSEANTKLVLASLKNGAKTMTELMMVTGLTRQTILKKIEQLSEDILSTEERPRRYYLKGHKFNTVVDEAVVNDKPQSKLDSTKNAIVHGTGGVVFFPNATANDYSVIHDKIMNGDISNSLLDTYKGVKSTKDLAQFEHNIKSMYDLIQWRKTLKGEFE